MKTLMHTCCAPCSVSCIHQLRGEGIELKTDDETNDTGEAEI